MASIARNAAWTGGFAILIALICLPLRPAAPASAEQLLLNGGFEDGASSWSGPGFGVSPDCARSGSLGGLLSASSEDLSASVSQTIMPASLGTYTLRGFVRLAPGAATPAPTFNSVMNSFRISGLIRKSSQPVSVTAGWTAFTVSLTETVPDLRRIRVDFVIGSSVATSVCIDDLTLDGPALATSTPTPTPSPSPTETPAPTSTAVSTAEPSITATSAPSATPTARTASATSTTRPTTTPVPSAARLEFTNGGFEDGLEGWQKFGGELRAVANPRNTGAFAGALTSTTNSTKWAYQVVRVDAALFYELKAAVMPGDGVLAYLRISWYASNDGTGAALATDDSTSRAPGPSGDFVQLNTGAKSPPPNARSARVRILLTPSSAAAAGLYIDDVWFGPVPPPATPPSPSVSVAPEEPPEPIGAPALPSPSLATMTLTPAASPRASASPTVRASSTARPSPTSTVVASAPVESVAFQRVASPAATYQPPPPATEGRDKGSGSFELIAGSAVLFGIAGAGAFVWAKRRSDDPV